MSETPPRAILRPEIQALRAVAVAAVLLFHLWPNRLTGGYVGVDVFFAISGFLITSHLLREVDATGRVDIPAFWARRIRRLLPASLLVLAVTAFATYAVVPQQKWEQYFSEIGASALYVQNWLLAHNAVDYLAADNAASPVQHFWTLSAEEQFYAVWPLLIGIVLLVATRRSARFRRSAILSALALLTAASLVYSIVESYANPSVAYLVTPTRIWEFGLGAVVAFCWPEPAGRAGVRAGMSWLGIACIAVAAVAFDGSTAFPGYAALLPVAGALLVIVAGPTAHPAGTLWLARLRPVQFLGDVSYSVYLWHWPMIVLVPYVLEHEPGRLARITILCTSVLLAWLTKVLVEDPVRFSPRLLGRRRARTVFAWSVGAMALVVAIASSGWNHMEKREAKDQAKVTQVLAEDPDCLGAKAVPDDDCGTPDLPDLVPDPALAPDDGPTRKDCWSDPDERALNRCTFGDRTKPEKRIAVVGDSHARQYYEAIRKIARKKHWQVDMMARSRCPWSTADRTDEPKVASNCKAWKAKLTTYLEKAKPYDAILTSYQSGPPIKVRDGADMDEQVVRGFVEAWKPVAERGTRIVALRDVPRPKEGVVDCVAKHQRKANDRCDVSRSKAMAPFDGQVEAVERTPRARLVDLTDLLCGPKRCNPVIGDVVVYRKGGHLTDTYVKTLTPYLRKRLAAKL